MRLATTPNVSPTPPIELPLFCRTDRLREEDAVKKIVQGWLEVSGPITANALALRLGLPVNPIAAALIALESAGIVMRGQFSNCRATADGEEWCDRVLLARIHRMTLGRMRKEIEPVTAADFMNFLMHWQHVTPERQLRGRDGILTVIEQLQGLEQPAPAWEQHILPARIAHYDPADSTSPALAGMVEG